MDKPPVSILQELMKKKNITPEYALTYNGTGIHNATFTYQVTCNGIIKSGTGRSKKEAKHNAARAMLEDINSQHDSISQLPIKSNESCKRKMSSEDLIPSEETQNSSTLNIPEALKEVCLYNKLALPEYNIKQYCPDGATVFIVECVVSTFKETATEETLDFAMQEAARKVWAKLQIEFQKKQNIKQKNEIFDQVVHSAETLLQSYQEEDQVKKKVKRKKILVKPILEEKKKEILKLPELIDPDIMEKSSNVPLLDAVEVLNQMCTDINLQKPVYEDKVDCLQLKQSFIVTCTVSTFKVETRTESKTEAKREAAKKMIEKIQSAVQKLQNSEKLDLQCEEVKFFVTGTVMSMLETISHQTISTLSSQSKTIKIGDDSQTTNKKLKSKNAIKALKELCKDNNLDKPRFEILEEDLFYSNNCKVVCVVSRFKEESQGTCVEEAKMKAAQKVVDKFTKLQNSYLKQLISSVKSLDYRNPSRWKTQLKNIEL